jgi:hypothetical protein
MAKTAPLTDAIVFAVARLVDDSQTESRFPSHSDIEFMVGKCGLTAADPKSAGQVVGKAKRVRAILSWAIEHAQPDGERLTALLVANVRSAGGFRESSPNYVGRETIEGVRQSFADEGYDFGWDGTLQPRVLDSLSHAVLTDALASYVRRARRGAEDAALLTGTGKDLLEATAAHILTQRFGTYSSTGNFPTLLGQAFVAAGLATSMNNPVPGEPPQKRLERALFEAGCAVNALRNKEGTGHGRPWLPSVTDSEATAAVELMGIIADRLLSTLPKPQKP